MRQDYYFDDLDIENFFIEDQREPGVLPTKPGLVNTKPETTFQQTAPRVDPMMGPVKFNADGALKDKLKAFVKSKKGKTILKITAGIGGAAVLIAFGPEIIAALAPLLPAMKGILAKQGIKAKGAGDVIKKFHSTQVGDLPKDAKGGEAAKAILKGILGFFKKAKEKRAAGTASPLEELALSTADNTLKKLTEGNTSVDALVNDETPTSTPGKTKEGTETTSTEKKGLDMKLVLVILVAVFFLTRK
jgi:hypothetical protein